MTIIPQDPAAGPPVSVRAARASVPGGPAAPGSPPLAAGGKTPSPLPVTEPREAAAGDRLPVTGPGEPFAPGPGREPPQTPAGASGPDSPPAGSTALSGAAWRAAAKAAQSKARRGRPARSTAAKPAAKVTTPPPVTGGAALTAVAACLGRCDWTAGPGDPAEVDKAAAKHTKAALGHPTNVISGPAA